jgi:hypothetical protein
MRKMQEREERKMIAEKLNVTLEECPFCGGGAAAQLGRVCGEYFEVTAYCLCCGARIVKLARTKIDMVTEAAALISREWNRRIEK